MMTSNQTEQYNDCFSLEDFELFLKKKKKKFSIPYSNNVLMNTERQDITGEKNICNTYIKGLISLMS